MSRFSFSPFHSFQTHNHTPTPTDVLYLNLHGRLFRVSSLVVGLLPDSVLLTLFPSGYIPFVSSLTGQDAAASLQNTRLGASSGIAAYFAEQEKLLKMRLAHRSNSIAVSAMQPGEQAAMAAAVAAAAAGGTANPGMGSVGSQHPDNRYAPFRRNSDSAIRNSPFPHAAAAAAAAAAANNANTVRVDDDDSLSLTQSDTSTVSSADDDNSPHQSQPHQQQGRSTTTATNARGSRTAKGLPFKKNKASRSLHITASNNAAAAAAASSAPLGQQSADAMLEDDFMVEFKGFNPIRDSQEIPIEHLGQGLKVVHANFDPRLFGFFLDYFKSLLQFEELSAQSALSPQPGPIPMSSKDSMPPRTLPLQEESDEGDLDGSPVPSTPQSPLDTLNDEPEGELAAAPQQDTARTPVTASVHEDRDSPTTHTKFGKFGRTKTPPLGGTSINSVGTGNSKEDGTKQPSETSSPSLSKPPLPPGSGDKKPMLLSIAARRRLAREQQQQLQNSEDSSARPSPSGSTNQPNLQQSETPSSQYSNNDTQKVNDEADDTVGGTPTTVTARRRSSFSFQPFFRRLSSFTLSIMTNLPNSSETGSTVPAHLAQQANVGPTPTPIVQTSVGLPIPTGWKNLAILREEAEVFVIPMFASEKDKMNAYRIILSTDEYLGEQRQGDESPSQITPMSDQAPNSAGKSPNDNDKSSSSAWGRVKGKLRGISGHHVPVSQDSISASEQNSQPLSQIKLTVDQSRQSDAADSIFEPQNTQIDDGSSHAERQMAAKLLQRRLQEHCLDLVQNIKVLYPTEFTPADVIFERTEWQRFYDGKRGSLDPQNTKTPRLRGGKVICESDNPLSKNDLLIALAELVCGHAVSKSAAKSPNAKVGIEHVGSFLSEGSLDTTLAQLLAKTSKELSWSYREKEESKFKLSSCLIVALKSADLLGLTKSKPEEELLEAVRSLEGDIRIKDLPPPPLDSQKDSVQGSTKGIDGNTIGSENELDKTRKNGAVPPLRVSTAGSSGSSKAAGGNDAAASLMTQVSQSGVPEAISTQQSKPGSRTSLNFLRAHLGMKRPVRKSWWEQIELENVVLSPRKARYPPIDPEFSTSASGARSTGKQSAFRSDDDEVMAGSASIDKGSDSEETFYELPSVVVGKVKVWIRRTWTVEFCSV